MVSMFAVLALLAAPAAAFSPASALRRASCARHATVRARPTMATTVEPTTTTPLEHPAIYPFGGGDGTEGATSLKWLLGGKGSNLSEMAKIGLAVPPGFTMTTEVCDAFHKKMGGELAPDVWENVLAELGRLEEKMGAKLGDRDAPLLLSVRSGAAISMPGMMDTVLNLGMTDAVAAGLAAKTGNARFAYDSYRRFLDMFGDVVMGVPHRAFETQLAELKAEVGAFDDADLTADDLRELVARYKRVYAAHGSSFPDDPLEQLRCSISAVFDSWRSERALKYMELNQISGLLGTAVNVQAMVFGNMGATSGTGVCFTRDPSTGDGALYGEFLVDAQGEDVVAGIRTPEPIARMEELLPSAYETFVDNCALLEAHFKDMQDIEFTVQEGKLYMLQCRSGKRTGAAAVKIAVDALDEGLVDARGALGMVTPDHLDQLLHPQFAEDADDAAYKAARVAVGLPASPGAAVGTVVFSSAAAEAARAAGEDTILVRDETSPEDVGGMFNCAGILTARGGMTSHAAVVARGWGKPCVCGCAALRVDEAAKTLTVVDDAGAPRATFHEGDAVSLNGNTGDVLAGARPLAPPAMSAEMARFMGVVDDVRELKVLANADTPDDAATARKHGAEGIGLVRSEHMFFAPERLAVVREMICAPAGSAARGAALDKLLPFQRADYEGIFAQMTGLPVTIRLLDPPLHEFLPDEADVAADDGALKEAIERLREVNPMLGLRGCRLGITSPDIIAMQARAIFEGALDARERHGADARPDVMVPLIGTVAEFVHQAKVIRETAAAVFAERGAEVEYRVGTMIEIPRAALLAGAIASPDAGGGGAEFFSFGTNDLTQMTLGYSRDDVGSFLPKYLEQGVLAADPFQVFDQEGVGQLVQMATAAGRAARPGLKVGVCGEHGGEPSSIDFFHRTRLDYVSCSPLRVPIARLAAAQAAAKHGAVDAAGARAR